MGIPVLKGKHPIIMTILKDFKSCLFLLSLLAAGHCSVELPNVKFVDCMEIFMLGLDKCLLVKFSYLEEYAGLMEVGSPNVLVGKLYSANGTKIRDSRVSASFESDSDFFVMIHDPSDEELYELKVDLQTGETENWVQNDGSIELDVVVMPPDENTTTREVPLERQVSMPTQGFRLKVQPIVDQAFRTKFGSLVQTRVNAIIEHSKTFFAHGSLKTKFELDVQSLHSYPHSMKATVPDLQALDVYIGSGGGSSLPLVNTYALLTSNDWQGAEGIAWVRTACKDRGARTNINEHGRDRGDLGTARTLVHEIGHNLGISHDFSNSNENPPPPKINRYSSTGQPCTDVGGYMDYFGIPNTWSPCSVEDMTSYYNEVGPDNYCMSVLGDDGSECEDNASQQYYCDNNQNWGGCSGSYQNWFYENCKKTCGHCGDSSCKDEESVQYYCDNNQNWGGCRGSYQNWFYENCKKTCGHCDGGSTCQDNGELQWYCDNNQSYGGCNGVNQGWFFENCKSTCGHC